MVPITALFFLSGGFALKAVTECNFVRKSIIQAFVNRVPRFDPAEPRPPADRDKVNLSNRFVLAIFISSIVPSFSQLHERADLPLTCHIQHTERADFVAKKQKSGGRLKSVTNWGRLMASILTERNLGRS